MAARASWRPTRRQVLTFAVLTIPSSGAFLLLDLALDPALLDRMWRTGHTAGLLWILGVASFWCLGLLAYAERRVPRARLEHALNLLGWALCGAFFAIISIAVLDDPGLPNVRYLSLAVLGFSCGVLGHLAFVWSLAVSLRAARVRQMQAAARVGPATPEQPAPVGGGFVRWVIAIVWSVVVLAVTAYAAVLAQTHSLDLPALLRAAAVLGMVYVTALGALGWMLHRAQRYAQATDDVVLRATVGSRRERRLTPSTTQTAALAPDLKVRWPIVLATGIGLAALSLLALVVLDLYVVRGLFSGSQLSWTLWLACPVLCQMGLLQASARRYPQGRYRRLQFAAGAFVLAGDTLLLDGTHPVHVIVPAPALLILSVLFALAGVLTCRTLLLSQMSDQDAHHRPRLRRDPLFLLILTVVPLPLLIVLAHLVSYGARPVHRGWAEIAFFVAVTLMTMCLAADPRTLLRAIPDAPPEHPAL